MYVNSEGLFYPEGLELIVASECTGEVLMGESVEAMLLAVGEGTLGCRGLGYCPREDMLQVALVTRTHQLISPLSDEDNSFITPFPSQDFNSAMTHSPLYPSLPDGCIIQPLVIPVLPDGCAGQPL